MPTIAPVLSPEDGVTVLPLADPLSLPTWPPLPLELAPDPEGAFGK